jgi:NAD(P) transhydrogenase subunit alpha
MRASFSLVKLEISPANVARLVVAFPRNEEASASVMKIGVPSEVERGEQRVAATPDSVRRLTQLGFEVLVESGAGQPAGFSDAEYQAAGAEIAADTAAVWNCGLVTKVCAPQTSEIGRLREGGVLVSLLFPAQNEALVQ